MANITRPTPILRGYLFRVYTHARPYGGEGADLVRVPLEGCSRIEPGFLADSMRIWRGMRADAVPPLVESFPAGGCLTVECCLRDGTVARTMEYRYGAAAPLVSACLDARLEEAAMEGVELAGVRLCRVTYRPGSREVDWQDVDPPPAVQQVRPGRPGGRP